MVTVAAVGEDRVIERLARRLPTSSAVVVGVGDDAAVLRPSGRRQLLLASDMLVEGVHFNRRDLPARWIGWKALACNLSDVAAMAGRPMAAVVSLGVPRQTPLRVVEALYDGLRRCAQRFDVALAGGDTVRAPILVIDVAILGTVAPGQAIRRRGARLGDRLVVTGRLGGSLASGHHARFLPRLRQAQWLARRHGRVHAMMDLSDGLAMDLWRLSRASSVVLQVREAAIPVTRAATACRRRGCRCRRWGGLPAPRGKQRWKARQAGRPAVWHALMDGEDFELLAAIPPRAVARLPRGIDGVPITAIGEVVRLGVGVELVRRNGNIETLTPAGFRHF